MRTPGAAAVEAEMKGFKVADVASSGNDEFYTPAYAITPLRRHLPPPSSKRPITVWCPFDTEQCLEKDDLLALDVDCMVLWTLHRYLGFGVKRLHDFYLAMAAEHRRMREFYEMDDLYPERLKLKELGADVEQWQKEVLANEPKTLGKR